MQQISQVNIYTYTNRSQKSKLTEYEFNTAAEENSFLEKYTYIHHIQ
jgi:hypothetical protein